MAWPMMTPKKFLMFMRDPEVGVACIVILGLSSPRVADDAGTERIGSRDQELGAGEV
jgi:hypothetical protein